MMRHMLSGGYYGNWSDMPENMGQMMQNQCGMHQYGSAYGLFHLVFCVLIVALLVSLIRYFWKLGDKK